MRFISLCLLTILLSSTTFARLNPFIETDTFLEKKQEWIKQEKLKQQKLDEEAKLLQQQKLEQERLKKEQEVKLLAQKQLEEKQKQQKLEQERVKKEKLKQQKLLEEKLAKAKPKITESYKLLPFVKVEIIDNNLIITVDKKYKLINQDILKESNKILFDFRGDLSFYTVRKNIEHKNFKSFAIGTHQEKKFFRVVIEFSKPLNNYKETVQSKNGIVTIESF